MRKPVHTEDIHVRVSAFILAEAKRAAEQRGMSLPELTRHALRREIREAA